MSLITTYQTLKDAIAAFLGRDIDDATDIVVDNIDLMINLAEKKFARRLKIKQLMRRAEAPLNEEAERLPDNLARIISVAYKTTAGAWSSLQYVTPDQYRKRFATSGSPPLVYTLVGHEILFGPFTTPVVDELTAPRMEVVYWSTPIDLSDTQTTNEVLVDYPEIYLFGALVMSSRFLKSDQLPMWQLALEEAILEANEQTEETVQEGVSLTPSDMAP